MAYDAKVLADSISPQGRRLTTIEATLPRIVLAELNTHRQFSRNSASSRAIPVAKMLQRVKEDPFIPIWWGKNQKGMQAVEELDEVDRKRAIQHWLAARDNAISSVEILQAIDVHKQIANRLLEPWLWHTVIVTATEWANFFGLRRHKDAQPEFKKSADMIWDVREASTPKYIDYAGWHLPLIDVEDKTKFPAFEDLIWASAGRCARVSYLTHDGRRDLNEDVALARKLRISGHMSPLEHPARPQMPEESGRDTGNFVGWIQLRKEIVGEAVFSA